MLQALDIFFAKRAEPDLFERARRIPVGWLYVCGVVGTIANDLYAKGQAFGLQSMCRSQ